MVEGAYLLDDLDVEMIGDGIHLPPDFLRLIYKIKGPEHIALITDCIRPGAQNLPEPAECFSDKAGLRPVIVRQGVAIMPDGKSFAGSIATMSQVVETNILKAKLPICDVIRMASLTPARMLGMDMVIGSIESGKRADLLLLDREFRVTDIFLSDKKGLKHREVLRG